MATVERITTAAGARMLADRLLSKDRKLPLVLITAGGGKDVGLISAQDVGDDVGELAEVCWMPTGDATWAFAEAMPPLAQLFGDAARVYPLDDEWQSNPRVSRLHMCSTHAKAGEIQEALVGEAMQAAASAGLLTQRVRAARTVTGEVRGFPAAGRALIRGDFGIATVRGELVAADVEIERLLRVGMTIVGKLDEQDKLIDVAEMMLTPHNALSTYAVGDVVPARVRTVGRSVVAVEMHPQQVVEIGVARVTGDAQDDLRDLMSVGEVVAVRVERTDNWILSMLDVEDVIMTSACSLLPGGPPWIEVAEPPSLADAEPQPDREVHDPNPEPLPVVAPAPEAPTLPSRPVPGTHTHELIAAREALLHEQSTTHSLRAELGQLSRSFEDAEAQAQKAKREVEHLRTERRRLIAKGHKPRRPVDNSRADGFFNDPEQELRHHVYMAWVERIPAGEKPDRPLPEVWNIGERFIESMLELPTEVRDKVPGVIFEVLLGIADQSDGRELHQLRTGAGGSNPAIQRENGETCWRVSVQRNSPSAARLHFWRGNGPVEFSRVVRHDDMRP